MVDRLPPIAVSASHSQPRQAGLSQKSRLERSKPEAGGGLRSTEGEKDEGKDEVRSKNTRGATLSSLTADLLRGVGIGVTKPQITGDICCGPPPD